MQGVASDANASERHLQSGLTLTEARRTVEAFVAAQLGTVEHSESRPVPSSVVTAEMQFAWTASWRQWQGARTQTACTVGDWVVYAQRHLDSRPAVGYRVGWVVGFASVPLKHAGALITSLRSGNPTPLNSSGEHVVNLVLVRASAAMTTLAPYEMTTFVAGADDGPVYDAVTECGVLSRAFVRLIASGPQRGGARAVWEALPRFEAPTFTPIPSRPTHKVPGLARVPHAAVTLQLLPHPPSHTVTAYVPNP